MRWLRIGWYLAGATYWSMVASYHRWRQRYWQRKLAKLNQAGP